MCFAACMGPWPLCLHATSRKAALILVACAFNIGSEFVDPMQPQRDLTPESCMYPGTHQISIMLLMLWNTDMHAHRHAGMHVDIDIPKHTHMHNTYIHAYTYMPIWETPSTTPLCRLRDKREEHGLSAPSAGHSGA